MDAATYYTAQAQQREQQRRKDYGYELNMPDKNGMLVVYALIGLSFVILAGLIIALFLLTSSKNRSKNSKALDRMRRNRARLANENNENDENAEIDNEDYELLEDEDEENEDDEDDENGTLRHRRRGGEQNNNDRQNQDAQRVRKGKRYLEKMRRKEEKRAYNKALAEQREEQRLRDEERWEREAEQRKKEREEEEKLQRAIEERRREKERQEMEEYQQWKKLMMLEESGDAYLDKESFEKRAEELLAYVVEHKSVSIQEVAADFGVKPADVVDKLKEFEKEGRLTGVFDERGSYVYITPEEFEKVAKLISEQGRLSLKDITQLANTVIKSSQ